MTKVDIDHLMKRANRDLKTAENELSRPPEDVVSFQVCIYSRRALYKFLQVLASMYAKEQSESFTVHTKIENLIEFSSRFNKKLSNINFSNLHCRCDDLKTNEEENVYCLSVYKVRYCTNLAKSVKQIICEKDSSLVIE